MSNTVEQKTAEHKLDIRTYPIIEPKNNVVAFASATINDTIAINGIKIIDGSNGLFAQMPQTRDTKGNYRDVAFPVTKDLRLQLNNALINQYSIDINSVLTQIKDRHNAINKAPDKGASVPTADITKAAKKTGPEL